MRKSYGSLKPLVPLMAAAKPYDWAGHFGRRAPLELEIGAGNGEHLAELASDHPERDFIGVELLWGRVKKCLRKLSVAGVSNAGLIYGDVRPALEYLIEPRSLERVRMLFPCPWPGDDAGRHRLYGHEMLCMLNSRLVEGGQVLLVTDDREYFDWVLDQIDNTGFRSEVREIGADFRTKFEKKWSEGGQSTFYRLDLYKKQHIDRPLRRELDLKTHLIEAYHPERFKVGALLTPEPSALDSGDGAQLGDGETGATETGAPEGPKIRAQIKDFLHDPATDRGMARVVVVEAGLSQELWIDIRPENPAQGSRWRIAPARGCNAMMTDGVQLALDGLARQAVLPRPSEGMLSA